MDWPSTKGIYVFTRTVVFVLLLVLLLLLLLLLLLFLAGHGEHSEHRPRQGLWCVLRNTF